MALEKFWAKIDPRSLMANGNLNGEVTLSSTLNFRVGQTAYVKSTTQPPFKAVIWRVISPTKLIVYTAGTSTLADLSLYITADSATFEVPEQPISAIPDKEFERNVYEEGPVKAKRVIFVDEEGQFYDADNPVPVSATVTENSPQSQFIFRNPYPTADMEQSQILPNNTKKLKITVVDLNARLRVSLVENGTIEIDDGGLAQYVDVYYGNSYSKDGIKLINKTLYYQASKNDLIIEIEAWV